MESICKFNWYVKDFKIHKCIDLRGVRGYLSLTSASIDRAID